MRRPPRLLTLLLAWLLGLSLALQPAWLGRPAAAAPDPSEATATSLDQRARQAYAAARYSPAATLWQQAADAYGAKGEGTNQAMALSNLALSLRHLGQPLSAQQAIEASLRLLESTGPGGGREQRDHDRTLAQALNTQARLRLDQGQPLEALRNWRQASLLYRAIGEASLARASSLNQAEALRSLGHLAQARQLLEALLAELANPATPGLPNPPDPALRSAALLSLASTLQRQGDGPRALELQRQSLASAEASARPQLISAARLAIADHERSEGRTAAALLNYERARQASSDPLDRLAAGSARLSLLVDTFQYAAAGRLWPALLGAAADLSVSRAGLDTSLHLGQTLLRLTQMGPALPRDLRPSPAAIQALLQRCLSFADSLGDRRARSIALGDLGQLAEIAGAWSDAARLSQQALDLSLRLDLSELSARWSWQLGRIARAQGDRGAAIPLYEQAIAAQQGVRRDLAGAAAPIQASFHASVEPLYRQYIDLLTSGPGAADPGTLQRSRQAIEALQIAELNDFFREACLQPSQVEVDRIDPRAAVIYPIVLPERLLVIVRLPGADGALISQSQPLASGELDRTVAELQRGLQDDPIRHGRYETGELLPAAQRLHDWILKPFAAALQSSGASQLVFVPDGALRSVPMAVLHDGQNFLAQRYGVALAPGLQLRASAQRHGGQPRLLLAGLSEARDGFPALDNVTTELESIRRQLPASLLLNRSFTREALRKSLASGDYQVAHLATHGQFGSNAAETYLLAYDQRIPVDAIDDLLQASRRIGGDSLELLVLSACQTAAGDPAANLGLAAMAVRSGASTTLASLWPVSDEATASFMAAFYGAWQGGRISKADALREAQGQLLASSAYQHPFYWAAFTLLGDWS
ncbi:MAG: CHAT domain-containing protein [Cyanobium sp.]